MNSSNNKNNNSSDPAIGGLIYFLQNLSDFLPYTSLALLGTLTGVLGNLTIMGAILATKELRTTSNLIVFNLAVADFSISFLIDSFEAVGILWGQVFFIDRSGLCPFIAGFCLLNCEASLMSIGLIAFNRYIKICKNHLYMKWFSKTRTLLYCLGAWFIGFLINIPNFTGWGGYKYDHKTLNCMWDRTASQSYSIFFPMTSIVIPSLVVLGLYIRIFWYAVSSKMNLKKHQNSAEKNSKNLKSSLRIAKGLFISYIIFVASWLPYGLVIMTDFRNELPRTAYMYSMLFAHLNSSLNPILYALFNPLFQRGYRNLFSLLFCGKCCNVQTKQSVVPVRASQSNKAPQKLTTHSSSVAI